MKECGGPRCLVVKSSDISLLCLIIPSDLEVWFRFKPHTGQVMLAVVLGGFSRGTPVFAPPTDYPVSY